MLKIENDIFEYYLQIIKNKKDFKYKNEIFFNDKKEIEKNIVIDFYKIIFKNFDNIEINTIFQNDYFIEKNKLINDLYIYELKVFKEDKEIDIKGLFPYILIGETQEEEIKNIKILLINLSIFFNNLGITFLDNSYKVFIKKTTYNNIYFKKIIKEIREEENFGKVFVLYKESLNEEIYTNEKFYNKILDIVHCKDIFSKNSIYNEVMEKDYKEEINKLLKNDFEKVFFEYILKNNIYLENFFLKKDFLILERLNEKLELELILDYENKSFKESKENIFTFYLDNFFNYEKMFKEMKSAKKSIYRNCFNFNIDNNKLERKEKDIFLKNISKLLNKNMENINKNELKIESIDFISNNFF